MKRYILVIAVVSAAFSPAGLALRARTLEVSVGTVPLVGLTGYLAFDFVQGSAIPNNTVTVEKFVTDSILGAGSSSGSVTGSLVPGPLVLGDFIFFNEWLQPVTFGSSISFEMLLSTNTSPGGIPDSFSFFLLDNTQLPYPTSDPFGTNSIFEIDIDSQSPSPSVFTSSFGSATVSSSTPEPSVLGLVFAGLVMLGCGSRAFISANERRRQERSSERRYRG